MHNRNVEYRYDCIIYIGLHFFQTCSAYGINPEHARANAALQAVQLRKADYPEEVRVEICYDPDPFDEDFLKHMGLI